jgi:predicted nucleotidyltransferase
MGIVKGLMKKLEMVITQEMGRISVPSMGCHGVVACIFRGLA